MSNENQDVDLNNEEVLDTEVQEEVKEEKPKEKKKFTPEEQLAIHKRELKKLEKQLGLSEEPKEEKANITKKTSEVDYAGLAFYNSKSDVIKIESDEDVEFLQQTLEETGKSQKAILGSKWFQSELKERQAGRKTDEAVPKGTKRSSATAKDEISVAIARYKQTGELPEDLETRGKVVDSLIKSDRSNAQFYNS